MQRLQPQIRRLQVQYKDDRAKLNEELMAFYREHEINPVGGCLPLLIQMPVFSILFYVVRGLTNQAKFLGVQHLLKSDFYPAAQITAGFKPKYLHPSDELYQSLIGQTEMNAIGKDHFDLSISAVQALSKGFLVALPYIVLVAMIAFLSWYQQRQIMGRNPSAEVNPQQQMMMRIGPALYVFFAFVSPAAIGIYFLVSTLWRVGQQAFITRSLYAGEDSIGRQAQKAMQEAKDAKKNGGGTDKKPVDAKPVDRKPVDKGSRTSARNGSGNGATPGSRAKPQDKQTAASGASSAPKPHPRSRKKKKRK
jgi:YidC/Oxa1 family membrane protein insertase